MTVAVVVAIVVVVGCDSPGIRLQIPGRTVAVVGAMIAGCIPVVVMVEMKGTVAVVAASVTRD